MNEKEIKILNKIKNEFQAEAYLQRKQRIWVSITVNQLLNFCTWSKKQGFVHLSAISVTDWLDKEEYELTYHLWSYDDKILMTIKTIINRNNPIIDSVTPIWYENAQIHERELHELFGVHFKGNQDLQPLFLDDWQNQPPFKKDFNWRDYVKNEFYDKENPRERVYYD